MPERIGVAVGAFADPNFPAPEQSVWVEEKHHLLPLPEGMRAFEGNAPPRPAT
jgi:hypothetical protein